MPGESLFFKNHSTPEIFMKNRNVMKPQSPQKIQEKGPRPKEKGLFSLLLEPLSLFLSLSRFSVVRSEQYQNHQKEDFMKTKLAVSLGMIIFFVLAVAFQASAQDKKPIVIGFVHTMSGAMSMYGISSEAGGKIAMEEINAAGGFKVKGGKVQVVLKYYDTESSPEVSSSVTERAISDGARIIIMPPQSAASFTASERAERAGVLSVEPQCTADKLTERGFKYLFIRSQGRN